jgi:hypothetical protein
MPLTHHYKVKGRMSLPLYWNEQYGAILTPQHLYIEFCALSNGDVCAGVWETRCNRPFHALLVYRVEFKKCELYTAHDYRTLFPNVVFDETIKFDMDVVEK